MKPKVDRGKEIIKITTEINAIWKERREGRKKNKRNRKKIMTPKADSQINKIDKPKD